MSTPHATHASALRIERRQQSSAVPRFAKASLRRQMIGRLWWLLPLGGAVMSTLTGLTVINLGEEIGTDAVAMSADAIKEWALMLLFAAIFSAVLHCREIASGTIAREAVLHPNRKDLFWSKTLTAGASGTALGVFTAGLGLAVTVALFQTSTSSFAYSQDVGLAMAGIALCCVIASVFGLYIGMLARSAAMAVATVIGWLLLVDPVLHMLSPTLGKFLFSNALTSLVHSDASLLPVPFGLPVTLAWIVGLGCTAYRQTTTKDL